MTTRDQDGGLGLLGRLFSRRTGTADQPHHEESSRGRTVTIVVCTLISALLWFTFSVQETYTYIMDLQTVVRNLPQDRALSERPPEQVRVQVQGEGLSLFQLYYNPPLVPIDASLNLVDLEATPPDLPKNLRLESVVPRTYIPRTEPRDSKMVPVRLRATLTTPPTHDLLGPPRTMPDSVLVSGARSIIRTLNEWPTVRLSRDNVTDSLTADVALVDTLSGLVDRDVDQVRLIAESREFTGGERTIEVIVEGSPSSQKLVTLDPATILVRYRVLLSDFKKAETAQDFFATVRYDDIRRDTSGRVQPFLNLPSGVLLRDVKYSPPSLRYYDYLVEN